MKILSYNLISSIMGNQLTRHDMSLSPNNRFTKTIGKTQPDGSNKYINKLSLLKIFENPDLYEATKDLIIIGISTILPQITLKNIELTGISKTILSNLGSVALSSALTYYSTPNTLPIPIPDNDVIKKFHLAFKQGSSVDDKDDNTQEVKEAQKELKDYIQKNPLKTINIIEDIFTAFKNNQYNKFNSSEIWTDLLKLLSEQTDISNDTPISLTIADGTHGNTHLNLSFKILKEFMDSLQDNMCQNLGSFNDKDINKSVDNFIDTLESDKHYFKILNHNNIHYTGLAIQKLSDNNYRISHLNSQGSNQNENADFDSETIKNYLKNFIETADNNNIEIKYHSFFSNGMPFAVSSNAITGLNNNTNFTPYTQYTNACHNISVMNLLKFFVENS